MKKIVLSIILSFFLGLFISAILFYIGNDQIVNHFKPLNTVIEPIEDSTIYFVKRVEHIHYYISHYYIKIDGHLYYIELSENEKGEMYMEHCGECDCKRIDKSKEQL